MMEETEADYMTHILLFSFPCFKSFRGTALGQEPNINRWNLNKKKLWVVEHL